MKQLLDAVRLIAEHASIEILKVYDQGFDVEIQGDGSPLTMAD